MTTPHLPLEPDLAACDAALAQLPRLFRRSLAQGQWHPLSEWLRHYRLQQRQHALERAAGEEPGHD